MKSRYDGIPDVRDGLTREERVVLYVLDQTQKERGGRNVPTPMLWGRVCEYFYISPEDLSAMLARLGARKKCDLERGAAPDRSTWSACAGSAGLASGGIAIVHVYKEKGSFMIILQRFGWTLLASALMVLSASADTPPTGRLPDTATPLSYVLNLKVDPRADRFTGQVRIRVKLTAPLDHIWLHASEIDVAKIDVTDARGMVHKARFAARDASGVAELSFGGTLPAQEIEVAIDYSAAFNAKLQGLYKVKVGDDAYVVTQMEPTSARYAFPSFDEPRFKTPFRVTLTVPKNEVAIANTRQIKERPSADGKWKTLTFATTKPLPTYLIALAVGPWDVVNGPTIPPDSVRKEPI